MEHGHLFLVKLKIIIFGENNQKYLWKFDHSYIENDIIYFSLAPIYVGVGLYFYQCGLTHYEVRKLFPLYPLFPILPIFE